MKFLTLPLAVISAAATSDTCTFQSTYPTHYVAPKTSLLSPSSLDGDLTKAAWDAATWTSDFVDIQGSPPLPTPRFRTRAKMLWDDDYLYVGAEITEPNVWATLTDPQTIIFHDNDFEVFIDSNATNYMYKETEVNAFGTLWSLCLNKPYGDGGYENSTRVMEPGFDMMEHGLKSAVQITPPSCINDYSASPCTGWTVELAMPLSEIQVNASHPVDVGEYWRIDFSRVEWRVLPNATSPTTYSRDPAYPNEDNWVWNAIGPIAMHNPDMWGILQFGDESTETSSTSSMVPYAEWPVRRLAMNVYYASHSYQGANNGTWTSDVELLAEYAPDGNDALSCGDITIDVPATGGFFASVEMDDYHAEVDNLRFLTTRKTN